MQQQLGRKLIIVMDEGSLRLLFLALSKQKYVLLRSGEINDKNIKNSHETYFNLEKFKIILTTT